MLVMYAFSCVCKRFVDSSKLKSRGHSLATLVKLMDFSSSHYAG